MGALKKLAVLATLLGLAAQFFEKLSSPSHLLLEGSYNAPWIGWLALGLTACGAIGYTLLDRRSTRNLVSQKPEESARTINDEVRQRAKEPYEELQETCYLAIISGSPQIDRFSEWALFGAGAVFGLIVANLDSVTTHIDPEWLCFALVVFIASGVFAAVQKFAASVVRSGSEAYKTMTAFRLYVPDEQAFLKEARNRLPEPFWPMYRPIIVGAMKRGEEDPIYGSKLLLWCFQLQGLANIAQFALLLLALISLILGLR